MAQPLPGPRTGLAGIAQSTWSRIEAGTWSADNRHMLASIAQALQCSTVDLTGQPSTPTDRAAARVVAAVQATVQALLDTDLDLPSTVPGPRPLPQLAAEAAAIQEMGLSCRYAEAAGWLPMLLREAHAHLAGSDRQVEIAAGLSPGTAPISRQAALYLDLGRALADLGPRERAVRTLLQAERVGAERVHRSSLARETVRGLAADVRAGASG